MHSDSFTLHNTYLRLSLDPQNAAFDVESRELRGAKISAARLGIRYNRRWQEHRLLEEWSVQDSVKDTQESVHGALTRLQLKLKPDAHGIAPTLTFALPDDKGLLLWKIELENAGHDAIYLERLTLLQAGFLPLHRVNPSLNMANPGGISLHERKGLPAFFSNGWQSWSHTGAYSMFEKQVRSRLGRFTNPMNLNPGTPKPGGYGHFTSEMFAVIGDRIYRSGILLGFLSQLNHFGTLEAYLDPFSLALRMWANGDHSRLDPGHKLETDWAVLNFIHLDTPEPLAPYLEAAARTYALETRREAKSVPSGWCSWYHYFQNISAGIIEDNLETARQNRAQLPLELIQIDDGYQSQVGDWLSFKPGFPDGPAPLAERIRRAGFTPGIWLAPFIVHPKAQIASKHPEWLLHSRAGKPVNAGFVWDTFTNALDLTHPEALAYAQEVIGTAAHRWGYPYLKLDFLYAAALPGQYRDPTQTRAQVLRRGLEALRQAAGEATTLLGCGCPLGSAVGLVDAMRIGADVAPHWHPKYLGTSLLFKSEPNFPAARNAIQNALTRLPLHQRWWINDPDCLLLRPDTELSLDEVQSLATVIILTGGSLLLSDDFTKLPPERLKIAECLLPVIGQRAHAPDWFDSPTPTRLRLDLMGAAGAWRLLALFNWQDKPQHLQLNLSDFSLDSQQKYYARLFWQQETLSLGKEGLTFVDVPPHGCRLVALRPVKKSPQYLGSDLHLSQGLEVSAWKSENGQLELQLTRPGIAQGIVELSLPQPPLEAFLDDSPTVWHNRADNCYRFQVKFDRTARLTVRTA